MELDILIREETKKAIKSLYNSEVKDDMIQIQQTRKEFDGDKTLVVFPFLRISKKKPELTGEELGKWFVENVEIISSFNVIKGFLNLCISHQYWIDFLNKAYAEDEFGVKPVGANSKTIMIEYSSPNTNKPLHLGHIRNNVLGFSVAEILKANGNKVIKTNIVNDRGIHICKSMLAWQRWGKGETPETSGKKGDHLVGEYYVKFDQAYKVEIEELVQSGMSREEAKKNAPLILEAQEMLRKWEAADEEITAMWKMMNSWVYEGFDVTYKKLGVDFDIIYYESETYKSGKENVLQGLKNGVLVQKEDASVWANLTQEGLDEKILLRADGTSVYMTQDIGTAIRRHDEYGFDKHIYVVGNEQEYHFKVLSLVLKKLGYSWAENLYHLSYGMVELPHGKMKSREGTVVDADDLMADMIKTARKTSLEKGKLENFTENEKEKLFEQLALGALKYFILKVDPKRNMLFNPEESIDLNGNTAPFIQYTYARIQSIKRNAKEKGFSIPNILSSDIPLLPKEIELIKLINKFPTVLSEAGQEYSPAQIANYVYELVKEYNQFYHDYSILNIDDDILRGFRLCLSDMTGRVIKTGMKLLGIEVPNQM